MARIHIYLRLVWHYYWVEKYFKNIKRITAGANIDPGAHILYVIDF